MTPDDVKTLAVETLAHRIALDTRLRLGGLTAALAVEEILERVPVPVERDA